MNKNFSTISFLLLWVTTIHSIVMCTSRPSKLSDKKYHTIDNTECNISKKMCNTTIKGACTLPYIIDNKHSYVFTRRTEQGSEWLFTQGITIDIGHGYYTYDSHTKKYKTLKKSDQGNKQSISTKNNPGDLEDGISIELIRIDKDTLSRTNLAVVCNLVNGLTIKQQGKDRGHHIIIEEGSKLGDLLYDTKRLNGYNHKCLQISLLGMALFKSLWKQSNNDINKVEELIKSSYLG